MANFRKTYSGDDPSIKAADVIIGPLKGVIGTATWQIEILSGAGAVGSYAYQVSDGDDAAVATVDTKAVAGLYTETRTEPVHRIQILTPPAAGVVVRVSLSAQTVDEE